VLTGITLKDMRGMAVIPDGPGGLARMCSCYTLGRREQANERGGLRDRLRACSSASISAPPIRRLECDRIERLRRGRS
jgi:hypothetical protein